MTTTVPGIILEVSRQLNDQDNSPGGTPFLRWPKVDLLEYLNDAITQVANLCPHLVTAQATTANNSGSVVPLPSGAIDLISVESALVVSSGETYPVVRIDDGFVKTFTRTCDYRGAKYRPYNWSYEPSTPGIFKIYPPVPAGSSAVIFNVICRYPPELQPDADFGNVPFADKYHQPMVSWMQARAYEVDQESESSMKLALMHRADFFKMMKAIIDTDQALHAGTYRAPGRRK